MTVLITLTCFFAIVSAAALIWGLCVAGSPSPSEADKEQWFR